MDEGKDDDAAQSLAPAQSIERQAFDLLRDDFADRFVSSWEQRELGRVDSPLDFRHHLREAEELFGRARSRWEGFDMFACGASEAPALLADGAIDFASDDDGWSQRTVELALTADRFLATHTAYDLSRPDDLSLADLEGWLPERVSRSVLWASVAMHCAVVAATECHRLSSIVEEVALRWLKVNLTELYDRDSDAWYDRIRDALREVTADVAESREYITTYLGAARTALVLADSADSADALRELESLIEDLRAAVEEKEIKLDTEMRARLAAEAEAEQRRASDSARQQAAVRANMEERKKRAESVIEQWPKLRQQHPDWSDDRICEQIGNNILSPRAKPGAEQYMSKDGIRKIARKAGLLRSQNAAGLSKNAVRDSNTEPQT